MILLLGLCAVVVVSLASWAASLGCDVDADEFRSQRAEEWDWPSAGEEHHA